MSTARPDAAEAWLAEFHPEELADFPTVDTGRSHHDVALGEDSYYPADQPERPGTRREPQWRRREAIDSQHDEVRRQRAQRAAQVAVAAAEAPCEHCRIEPRRRTGSKLGETCYRYELRTGRLPSAALIRRRSLSGDKGHG